MNEETVRQTDGRSHRQIDSRLSNIAIGKSLSEHYDEYVYYIFLSTVFLLSIGKLNYLPCFKKIKFVCVGVLRTSQYNEVMSSASVYLTTLIGQAQSAKQLTSIVPILSPETDNS